MFERNKRDTSEDDSSFPTFEARETGKTDSASSRSREAAVIGPSIQINGDLSGEEDLIIEGKVKGTIQLREKSLTVGAKGQVDANVLAHTVIVEGEVNGDLYGSQRVSIRKTGNVKGNIISPKVSLDEGCRFKGSIDMDQAIINKAFDKSTGTAPRKSEQSSSKPKSVSVDKTDKPASGGAETKAGSSGTA